jgi:hypothetical protein
MKNENLQMRWWNDWWVLFPREVRKDEVKEVLDGLGVRVDWERLKNVGIALGNEPHRTVWEVYREEGKLEDGISPRELPTGVYVVVRVDAKSNEFLRMRIIPVGGEGGEPIVITKKIPANEINPWGWNTFYPPIVLVSHQLGVIVVEVPFPKNRKFWCRAGSSSRYWRIWYIPRRYWNDYVNVFEIKKEVRYESESCGNSN